MTNADIRDLLLGPPDGNGECYKCHAREVAVWMDRDSTEAENRQLCGPCWRARANRQQLRPAPTPTEPQRQKQLLTGMDCARGQRELFSTDGTR